MMIITFFLLLISPLWAPWWVAVALAIIAAPYRFSAFVLIPVGLLYDTWFGVPIALLYGFQYLYTSLFGCMAFSAFLMRRRMLSDV